jgi:hypothetical protein
VRPRLPPPGWKRWLAIAAMLALAVRVVLPYALETLAESQGSTALGVPLRVGDVDLQLVRGGLALEQLRVGSKHEPLDVDEVDQTTALLSLARLYARISWPDLLRGRIRLRELELDAPVVHVAREPDGRIAPLPERPAQAPAPEEPEEPGDTGLPLAIDRLALRGARLGLVDASDPGRELLGFGLEELSAADFALGPDGITLGEIGLRQPRVQVLHELAALDDPTAPRPPPVAAPPPAPPVDAAPAPVGPPFDVKRIAIERAQFSLLMNDSTLDVTMAFSADGVTARRGVTFPARLALELAKGTLEIDGTVGIDPPFFDGSVQFQHLGVPQLLEPLRPGPLKRLRAATASGDLKLRVQPEPADGSAPGLRLSGALDLADLAVHDPDTETSVAWKALDVDIEGVDVPLGAAAGAPRAALRKLRLVEPAVRVVVPARPAATDGAAQTPPVDAAPPAPAPQVSLGALELVGGRVELVDRSVSPEYRAQLRKLGVSARDVRWPEGDVRDLRASLVGPAQAALDLRGGLRRREGELDLRLERLALPGLNPYAKSFAGVELASGAFSLQTNARAAGGSWKLRNDLSAHDLSLASGGSTTLPAVGLPLSSVLALLRDSKGDIRLRVPVELDAGGTRTGLGTILLGALRQALVGVVSSPLKVLGFAAGAVGAGGDPQPAALACTPGSAELAESEAEKLGPMAALLSERPVLGLVLRGRAGGADGAPVAEQMLRERLEAGTAPELPDSGFLQRRRLRNALEARARGEDPELEPEDREALERWIGATPVPPERLQELAALRAELLLENLVTLHAIPRARLSLADPLEGEPAVALEIAAVSANGNPDEE